MACPLCHKTALNGIALSNGEIVHQDCHQNFVRLLMETEGLIKSTELEISSLRSYLQRQLSTWGSFIRFWGGGENPEIITSLLIKRKEQLSQLKEKYNAAKSKQTSIYDLMLNYPPDWHQRKNAVFARDKHCTRCLSSNNLHVHHIIHLSQGGTNLLSNLILLCEECHQKAHHGKPFSGNDNSNLKIGERIEIIKSAINSGLAVEFLYKKPTDLMYIKRTVTPHELINVDHLHGSESTLCLKGYCHLRHEDRIFALKRMMSLKVL